MTSTVLAVVTAVAWAEVGGGIGFGFVGVDGPEGAPAPAGAGLTTINQDSTPERGERGLVRLGRGEQDGIMLVIWGYGARPVG